MPYSLRRCERCRFSFEALVTEPNAPPAPEPCRQCGGPTLIVEQLDAPSRPAREGTRTQKVQTIAVIPPSLLPRP